ncbi:hypothetical protein [Streptomyces sp. NBC_01477]|uniref:hypothetical protein n=1 Tax=Streptomyces sp. NBC_01477 TaxID=2976015 RepID=UPI002E3621CC|nr:hypothetical protein [Streptomyces sp. NBC_01477]
MTAQVARVSNPEGTTAMWVRVRVRAAQQTPGWKTRYAVRSGVEGTVNETVTGRR